MINATLNYTATSADEFLSIVQELRAMGGVNLSTNVTPVNPGVVIKKPMGPLETLYVTTTGKSMRCQPGLDREKVAAERLRSIGKPITLGEASKIYQQDESSNSMELPDGDVFGSLGDDDDDDDNEGSRVYVVPDNEDENPY